MCVPRQWCGACWAAGRCSGACSRCCTCSRSCCCRYASTTWGSSGWVSTGAAPRGPARPRAARRGPGRGWLTVCSAEAAALAEAARDLAAPARGRSPLYTPRLIMLLIANAVNWGFALYGYVPLLVLRTSIVCVGVRYFQIVFGLSLTIRVSKQL